MAAPAAENNKVGTNPFVGPRSFQTGEHLYGRSRESTELKDLLIAERIVLLYSPSGAGKSSLINAALIPGMRKEGFFVGPVLRINQEVPREAPAEGFNRYVYSFIHSLEESLPEETRLPDKDLFGRTIAGYLSDYRKRAPADEAGCTADGSLFLILDQFEEILRLNAADQAVKQEFFNQFGELLRTDRSLWTLIAIREDYLAAIGEYSRPIPNRLSVTYRLDFLDARAAIEAIQGPARDSGVNFEDIAASALVDSLRKIRVQKPDGSTEEQNGPYVEPVQLQVVCRRLWEKSAAKGAITLADVTTAGNIDDALSDYYSDHVAEAVKTSGVSERQIREWFDRKLITPIGIRGQVLMEPEVSGGLPNTCIKLLQEAYLVRGDKRGNATWFELAHDRLTRPIRRNNSEWFSQHLSVFQRQADFWNLQGRPDSLILTGTAYLEAEQWVKDNPKALEEGGPEKDFLEACRQEHKVLVRERRLNTTIRWASLGLLALTAAAIFFFVKAQDSADQANKATDVARTAEAAAVVARQASDQDRVIAVTSLNIADVRKLVAQSVANLTVDPEVSVKLALSALDKVDPNKPENADVLRQVEDALRRALPATRVEQVLTDPAVSQDPSLDHTFTSVSFDSAGTRIAVGSADGSLRVWSTAAAGGPVKILQVFQPAGGQPGVTRAVFSPDGKLLAAATGSGHVVLYDAATYAIKKDEAVQKSPIFALAFNRDGSRLAVGGAGGTVQIWNTQDTSNRLFLSAGDADILTAAFSPDGTRLATGSRDGKVVVWDSGGGRSLYSIDAHKGAVSSVAFSRDGRQLATAGTDDRFINLWSLAEEAHRLFTISGHRDSVNAVAFTRDGTQLISASSDRTVRFWDTSFGRPGMVLYGHTDQVYSLSVSPDGNHVASTGKDNSLRVWNIAPEGSREYFTFSNGTPIHDLSISPDGSRMAAAGEDGNVNITVTGSNTRVTVLKGHTAPVEAAAFSPDGRRVITASQDGTAKIWNADGSGTPLTLQGHTGQVWDAVFSPDGKQAATAGQDGSLILWDAQAGKPLQTLKADAGAALAVAFNPDGSLLAAGYANSQIILWNTATGAQAAVLKGHTDAVRVVIFQPKEGRVLASAGDDGSLRLWDMTSDPIGKTQASLRENGDAIFALAFTNDGKHLFSGGADGIGTVWDMEQRQADFQTYGQTDRIAGVAVSRDGANLFTGGWDGTLRMHVFDFTKLVELAKKRGLREYTEEECRQLLNAACPSAVSPAPTQVVAAGAPTQTAINKPAPSLFSAEAALTDPSSAGPNGLSRAQYSDDYQLNKFERPFNSDMSIYYPDVDIQSATMSESQKWLYFTISLAGQSAGALSGNYAIELDMDGDGRGDHLIITLAPGKEWSTSGVRIWEDQSKSPDVGGGARYTADPPQKGDGYETLVFDQGSGDGPDLAWSRIAPDSPNTVQIALLRTVVNTTSRNDESFVWTAWASHDSFQPAWFDYNDHFTAQEVGEPIPGKGRGETSVLTNLPGLDNTCRYPFGVDVKGDIFCKP